MKQLRLLLTAALTLMGLSGGGLNAQDKATVGELITAARKEGVVEFYGPSTLTPKGAQALGAAFNKKYGLSVTLNFSPAGSMYRDISKIITSNATGVPVEWDLVVMTDAHYGALALKKQLQKFDYGKLGVAPELVHHDSAAISFANQYVLPAYNTKLVSPKDLPKSWEDLADPKWKGGKLGVSSAIHHFARLTLGAWGEEKGAKFVRALAEQKPNIGLPGEIHARLEIGEVLILVNQINEFVYRAKVAGAPMAFAEGIEPVIAPALYSGVPRGAKHPNAGFLFAAFLATPEAQEVWEKHTGLSSAFVPGTTMNKFARGKKMLYLRDDQAEAIDRLSAEYNKIMGITVR